MRFHHVANLMYVLAGNMKPQNLWALAIDPRLNENGAGRGKGHRGLLSLYLAMGT